jgi:hypothetical protein
LREFEFSSTSPTDFADQGLVRDYAEQFYTEFGSSAVLVMLMHSWSFLYQEKKGERAFYYEAKGGRLAETFAQFLGSLNHDVKVTTASELDELIKHGAFKVNASRSIEEVDSINSRIKALASASLPVGAAVAVISKGDEDLLKLDRLRGRHFPHGDHGSYIGYHPADDAEAIAKLEASRAEGAQFLLIPASSLWWLDYYTGFRQHLDQRYSRMWGDEDCVIYRLEGQPHAQSAALSCDAS